ncbi:hypothetical protein JOD24_002764 [Kroppenstedtia sanguinis]
MNSFDKQERILFWVSVVVGLVMFLSLISRFFR